MQKLREYVRKGDLSEEEKARIYEEFSARETHILRLRRARLKSSDFQILAQIGRGGFAEVYLCKRKDTGEILVLKKMVKKVISARNKVR